jgi:CRP-like cAMP-binding protein
MAPMPTFSQSASPDTIEGVLQRCNTFEPLSDERIAELAAGAEMRSLDEGQALFEKSSEARELFVVASGRLTVRLATPAGQVVEVYDAGRYSLTGWSALVAPHVYLAEAHALEATTVVALQADDVEKVLLREPAAGYAVMKKVAGVLAVRLRDLREELIEQLGD